MLLSYLFRGFVTGVLKNRFNEKFTAIDAAIGSGWKGAKIVFLIRLSPLIPYSVTNYVCGCTSVPFLHFVLGTWLGVLPGTTAYVSMGAVSKRVRDGETSQAQLGLYAVGAVATVLVSRELSRIAERALNGVGVGVKNEKKKD
eukprot:c5869_g1_i1.p1 GENE.c5869_g1_i1~~c5869_g1_i1.p1  ORF type:complete len:143 (+),score=26.84 c5869_g1_i1:375-803(+)